MTITFMAGAYMDGLKDYVKAQEIYRLALDGYEKWLGEDHEGTKMCAISLAVLLCLKLKSKKKMRSLVARCPHLTQGDAPRARYIRSFIA